jgi:hypothetical protein
MAGRGLVFNDDFFLQEHFLAIVSGSVPIDDQEIRFGLQGQTIVMPTAATIIDALTGSG